MSELTALPLQTPSEYREPRAHVFRSAESLRWFIRTNRAELVKAGAVIYPTGSPRIHPDRFDEAVLQIGQRRAERLLGSR